MAQESRSRYEFEVGYYHNAFGARTDSYARLYRDGEEVESRDYFFHRRAVNKVKEWRTLYDAVPR